MVKKIAHRRYAAKHGAVAQGYQHSAALAHADGYFFIGCIVDAAFQYAHIYTLFIGFFQSVMGVARMSASSATAMIRSSMSKRTYDTRHIRHPITRNFRFSHSNLLF